MDIDREVAHASAGGGRDVQLIISCPTANRNVIPESTDRVVALIASDVDVECAICVYDVVPRTANDDNAAAGRTCKLDALPSNDVVADAAIDGDVARNARNPVI